MIQPYIFVSYAHSDHKWLDMLLMVLKPLERNGRINTWSDKDIGAGTDWRNAIEDAINQADAAILLISPAFLASRFIMDHELPPLLERGRKHGLKIFWIAVSSSLYEQTAIASYQAANNPAKPLDMLRVAIQKQELVRIGKRIIEGLLDIGHLSPDQDNDSPQSFRNATTNGPDDVSLATTLGTLAGVKFPRNIHRGALRSSLVLGWQLARYEIVHETTIPELKDVIQEIRQEIDIHLVRDGLVQVTNEMRARPLTQEILEGYGYIDSERHAAILIGIAGMMVSVMNVSNEEIQNLKIREISYSAIMDIDPSLIPTNHKLAYFEAMVQARPQNITQLLDFVDHKAIGL